MSESRKKHLSLDGGQEKEDEHVASYKPIPETDKEFRISKSSLAKSKEKVSQDGAEEKLLAKEAEAKIVTRVDMADAKYVVEDYRNGGAKIELDANKKQFSGLTREELMKYAEDPFWVKLRWFMFILFWAAWLGMLAGAIMIIIKAPKCAPNPPRTWFEKGPLVDMGEANYEDIEPELPNLQSSNVKGIFVDVPSYNDEPSVIEQFHAFVLAAEKYGIKVIADLVPNYVNIEHRFFNLSSNKVAPYKDYFVWADGKDHDDQNNPKPPNNWVSTKNTSAWTYNSVRGQFYLHQYGENQPDLNFNNKKVVAEFDKQIEKFLKAGADGIRLNKVRQLLVNQSLPNETPDLGRGSELDSDHTHYVYWRHQHTSDLPQLDSLLSRWAGVIAKCSEYPRNTVFTVAEESGRAELFLLAHNMTELQPLMTAPIFVGENVTAAAHAINRRLGKWPAIQLKSTPDAEVELAALALLLPATPVYNLHQLEIRDNDTTTTESLSHLVPLRDDASVEHGHYALSAVRAAHSTHYTLIACARWKAGHTGYVAVYNPADEEQRANLTQLPHLSDSLTVHHMSHRVKLYTNYTTNYSELADNVLVPPKSTIVLSYVPKTSVEN